MSEQTPQSFLERFGRFWEAQGGSRIAGKIVGWMMVCEPSHQSVADIVAVLGVSHGSVSTQTRQLAALGYLERATFPGDRTSYFVLNHEGWSGIMTQSWMGPVSELHALAEEAKMISGSSSPDRATDLVLMTEFLIEEWPDFAQRMKSYIAEQSSAASAENEKPTGEAE